MKVKRMGIKKVLEEFGYFLQIRQKAQSFSNQPTQLIVKLNSLLRHIIVTRVTNVLSLTLKLWPHILQSDDSNLMSSKSYEKYL